RTRASQSLWCKRRENTFSKGKRERAGNLLGLHLSSQLLLRRPASHRRNLKVGPAARLNTFTQSESASRAGSGDSYFRIGRTGLTLVACAAIVVVDIKPSGFTRLYS